MADPILVLAPDGRDAEVVRLVLEEAGLAVRVCADLAAACAALEGDVTALVVAEGALAGGMESLLACLDQQPSWSDLPVLVLTARGPRAAVRGRKALFQQLGNVTLLERPLHAEALQSAARSAARVRARQYRTRAHLAEIAGANALLERRVEERTAALQAEMAERRRVEEALRQAQKMEAVGQLTGGIAHDFNNLLQVVIGNLHALGQGLGDDRRGRHVAMAMAAAERGASLTARLLAFGRRQALSPRSLDLNRLVEGMEELLRRSVGEAVGIDAVLARDLWSTWADAGQVENALLNLAVNGRDAMAGGGTLSIVTGNIVLDEAAAAALDPDLPPGAYVTLRVEDTGTGMDAAIEARAFEPFFTTKPIGQGTGLGLSQVYGFARQSGGTAVITSRPGQGTAVTLYLPRRGEPEAAGDASTAPVSPPSTPSPLPPGETVLVVEDEALVLMLWVESLEAQGYTVLQAAHPDAALAIVRSGAPIDLLVSDVGLPGMDGRAMAGIARDLRPGLRTLFLTGYAHHADLGAGALGPGMRMLGKPVSVEALLAAVRSLLDGEGD